MIASLRIHAYGLAAGVILMLGSTGCGKSQINGGPIDSGVIDATPEELAALDAFNNQALPLLQNTCGGCHATDNEIGFLFADPDVYTRITGWPDILDFQNPANSLILTKGQHQGPPWPPEDFEVVKEWIELEAIARGVELDDLITTPLFTPREGLNTVNLDALGLVGSKITFLMELLDTGAYLSEIRVEAGTGGLHMVHPFFFLYVDGVFVADPVDRFSFVDLSLDEGQSEYIGGGTFVVVNFPRDSDMMIQFDVLEPLVGGGPDGGVLLQCLEVDSFTANAQPALAYCAQNCHGGFDPQAVAATDMRQLLNTADPAAQAEACGQILSRVNLADPMNSGIIIAPDPNSGTLHPYKFGDPNMPPNPLTFPDFVTAVTTWADTEMLSQP